MAISRFEKKNTLLFERPSNTGKSFIARLILQCFRFTNSLCNDNLFTFANIIDQDIVLWDEPMIHPDVADLAKTVLEGGQNLVIPIKHKLPGNTKRKVPIIICSNHEITNYCSSEYENIYNKCRLFTINNNILNATFCTSSIHNCQHLSEFLLTGNSVCFDKPSTSAASDKDQSNKETEKNSVNENNAIINCGLHRIHICHMLTFLVKCIGIIDANYDDNYKLIYETLGQYYYEDCCYNFKNLNAD